MYHRLEEYLWLPTDTTDLNCRSRLRSTYKKGEREGGREGGGFRN